MVTAELAVLFPVLVLVLAAMLTALSVLFAQLRCVDAAREAARAAARGEAAGTVGSLADRLGPERSAVAVVSTDREVRVTVSADTRAGGGLLPSFHVSASAVALRESEPAGAT